MPFACFETHVNKCFAIFLSRCQVISNCAVMLLWIMWKNILLIPRYVILLRELLAINSGIQSAKKRVIKEMYKHCISFMFGINKNLESPDMAWMLRMYTPWTTDMQIRVWYPVCKLGSVVSTAFYTTGNIHWFSHPSAGWWLRYWIMLCVYQNSSCLLHV